MIRLVINVIVTCFRYYSIKSEDCKGAGGGRAVGDNSVDNVDNVNKGEVKKCKPMWKY